MLVDLDHAAFLRAVEDTSLPAEAFDHRAHVRLAWICLRHGRQDRIAGLIRAFAEAKGATSKFDAELTRAWVTRVQAAMEAAPGPDFDAFLSRSPQLLRPTPSA